MSDSLAIDVPAPLAKFEGAAVIDPDNLIILSNVFQPKILNDKQLRDYRRKLKRLDKRLKRAHADAALAEWYRLRDVYYGLYFDLLDLKAQHEGSEDETVKRAIRKEAARIKNARRKILARGKEIATQLDPYRADLSNRATYRRRIEEYTTWKQDEREETRLRKFMSDEANYYAEIITTVWDKLKFCYYKDRGPGKKQKKYSVKFERVVATPDSVQFKIFVSRLAMFSGVVNRIPTGINPHDLIHDDVLFYLTAACERPVTCPELLESSRGEHKKYDIDRFANGIWLEVCRSGVTEGILDRVLYKVVMSRYEDRFRSLYALPLGVMRGRRINWARLVEHPHLLIAGQNGSGKSNAINVAIATLITRHTPDEIRLVLIDLKEGVELMRYENVPHVVGHVVTEIEEVVTIMSRLEMLRKQRMEQIRSIAQDIDTYNELCPPEHRMPRIVVVFDEYGALAINSVLASQVHTLTAQIAMKARASGIHLLIGAQSPYNDIVPNKVKANITFVLSGRQRTLGASMSTFSSGEATRLKKIAGRMVCENGMDSFQVQIPYISPKEIREAIEESRSYKAAPLPLPVLPSETRIIEGVAVEVPVLDKTVTLQDFIEICLEHFDGVIAPQKAHKFIEGATQRQMMALRDELLTFTSIEHNSDEYIIEKYRAGYKLSKVIKYASDEMPIPVDFCEVLNPEYVEEQYGLE